MTLIVFLSLYVINLKEPAIISLAFLGIGNILFYLNTITTKKTLIFFSGLFMLFTSTISLLIYFILINPYATEKYGRNGIPFLINLIKSIIEWIIADPFIFLLFIPVFTLVTYQNFKNKSFSKYDILSFGAIGYISTFFINGIAYSSHYLTPSYIFIIPFLLNKISIIKKLKVLVIICVIFQLGSLTLGINDIIFQKFNNKNFSELINKLDSITTSNYELSKERTTFHILGGKDQGNHFSYGTLYFMIKEGHNEIDFDISSFENIYDSAYTKTFINQPLYTFQNTNLQKEVKSGDYIVYTPYTLLNPDEDSYNKTLIKEWKAPSYLGYLNFKDLLRCSISKFYNNKAIIRDNKSYKVANYKLYYVD